MKNQHPLNQDEKQRQEKEPARIEPELTSDKFTPTEQKKIVDMVIDDAIAGIAAMADWKAQKEKDIKHLNCEPPSILENLKKKSWMSDRNLGMTAAVRDIYHATLLATCYNPDSIHFKDTAQNNVNNRDNLEKFTKWALGKEEADFFPEMDDFVGNRIDFGFSCFKIYWEVKYAWVDKRIPKPSKENKNRIIGYDIKTEHRRFERGVIKNIANLDDILIPEYGGNIQDQRFLIEVLHLSVDDLSSMAKKNEIVNWTDDLEKKLRGAQPLESTQKLRSEDEKNLGKRIVPKTDEQAQRVSTIDVYEWYGLFEKNGKYEEYRCWIEPTTRTFLKGKPLRKVNRSGKKPYVGGPLRRRPGFVRGGSLPSLIAPCINALNNNYNQTSDFQYVENCPFGFANFDEGFTEQMYDQEPGKIYNTGGADPQKAVYFPNLTRSLAWSYDEKKFLLEIIERQTGAQTYFLTSNQPDATATRDQIVEEKGQTKFGLWVKRIQADVSEAINMFVQLYQDWAPPELAERVLGEDGKQLIRNLSIDSIRGSYAGYMVPDITSGSKAYERQVYLWGYEALNASPWFNPAMNPRGSWLLVKDTMTKQGFANPEHYLPPQPKEPLGTVEEVKEEWNRFMSGETVDPDEVEGMTPAVVDHYIGHLKQYEEDYHKLPEEYRPLFDAHMFKTFVNYRKFMQQLQQEQMANNIAMAAIQNVERAKKPQLAPPQPQAPGMAPMAPPMANRPVARPKTPPMAPMGGE